MPQFEALAIDENGRDVTVSVVARTLDEAIDRLRGQGFYVTKISEASVKAKNGGASSVLGFFRNLFRRSSKSSGADRCGLPEFSYCEGGKVRRVLRGHPAAAEKPVVKALESDQKLLILKHRDGPGRPAVHYQVSCGQCGRTHALTCNHRFPFGQTGIVWASSVQGLQQIACSCRAHFFVEQIALGGDPEHSSCLIIAADGIAKGSLKITEIKAVGSDGLIKAIFAGNWTVVDEQIAAGADLTACDRNGFTPLLAASSLGNLDLIRLCLSQGANVNAQTTRGESPIFVAHDAAVVALLSSHGADLRQQNDRERA